jgi:hypothetical protein
MIRFDFDVVSDPLPPKPIRPPAVQRRPGEGEIPPESEGAETQAVSEPGQNP